MPKKTVKPISAILILVIGLISFFSINVPQKVDASSTNLATGKTATASSEQNIDYAASKANDSDMINTRWGAAIDAGAGTWLEIDFGASTTFNKVVFKQYKARVTGYKIQYYNGSSWQDAYAGTNPGTITVTNTFAAVTGTKARFYVTNVQSIDGYTCPSLYEFEIYNEVTQPGNLATGKTATASSEQSIDYAASKANDSDMINTRWGAAVDAGAGTWLEIDFGASTTFNKVVFKQYKARVTGYKIQYYNGSSWQDAYAGTNPGTITVTNTFAAVTGTKARFYVTNVQSIDGYTCPSLYEFEIYNGNGQGVTISNIERKVLCEAPGRYFARCSIQELPDGKWVLVYNEADHHYASADGILHIRFSDDYGETWSDQNKYLDGTPVSGFPCYPPGAAPEEPYEPSEGMLYLAPDGTLILHSWKCKFNVSPTLYDGTWQKTSTDGGKTWTSFARVDFVGIQDDTVIVSIEDWFDKDGIIYAGARWANTAVSNQFKTILIKSADNGQTWEYVSNVTEFSDMTIEAAFEYIGNNTIMSILCDNPPISQNTFRKYSYDMGQTWTSKEAITSQVGLWHRPRIFTDAHLKNQANWWEDSIIMGASNRRVYIGQNMPRQNSFWISLDGGDNWSSAFALDEITEDAGYGDLEYDPVIHKYVAILYHGTRDEAKLIQYKFNVTIVE